VHRAACGSGVREKRCWCWRAISSSPTRYSYNFRILSLSSSLGTEPSVEAPHARLSV
jgi:hypothetical protein